MTQRKPNDVSWESWTERLIQNGHQDGAFDDLDGHGRPIDGLGDVHDDMWWVKAKLRDEDLNYLPPTIAIRAERQEAIDAALSAQTEGEAREIIEHVNTHIRYINSHATAGPPSSVMAIEIGAFIERWRSVQPPPTPSQPASPPLPHRSDGHPTPDAASHRPHQWWRRWRSWRNVMGRSTDRTKRSVPASR